MNQATGERADRRNQPGQGDGRPEGEKQRVEILNRACLFLEQTSERDVSLEELGAEVGWSPGHLQRVFRKRIGVSPKEYSQALRVSRLKGELRTGDGGATRAIFESGFASLSSGHEAGLRHLGMTPATYGAGGEGARIEYRAVRCSLGWLMVGRTERGICSLTLGDDPDSLLALLQEEFPEAELNEGGEAMAELCERLVGIADRGEVGRDLPVEVVATEFQWRVWRAMREIPRGQTRSYSDLAEMAGSPKAVRAAASACANNRISLLIPCHRVVRADGTTGQYAWGAERKVKLLEAETLAVSRASGV